LDELQNDLEVLEGVAGDVDYGLEALSHLPEFAILGGGGECVAGDVGDVITNAQAAIEDASARLKLAKKELEDALAALTK
jgi:hypothetical protein